MKQNYFVSGKDKKLAVLLDPDKFQLGSLISCKKHPDYYFIGGSFISVNRIDEICTEIRKIAQTPIILFPGDPSHISKVADAVLYLSLVSGRNAEYLIGKQVVAAPFLKRSGLAILSTAYILVDGGAQTSVSYISNTTPIPANKPEIAAATALAAEMLGMQNVFLDAGSGANTEVSPEMIKLVRHSVDCPLIVGGGLKSSNQILTAFSAGADIVVVGDVLENDFNLLEGFLETISAYNTGVKS